VYWILGAFDSLAMGNYPYPTPYIIGDPDHLPPAFPMKVACQAIVKAFESPRKGTTSPEIDPIVASLLPAAQIVYNATHNKTLKCFDAFSPAEELPTWDWQTCTELMPEEIPYYPPAGPPNDMFFNLASNWSFQELVVDHCQSEFKVTPDPDAIPDHYGLDIGVERTCNVFYSEGSFDPWRSGGVVPDSGPHPPEGCRSAVRVIEGGAHHLDLFFENEADPKSVIDVRREELRHIRMWIAEHAKNLADSKRSIQH